MKKMILIFAVATGFATAGLSQLNLNAIGVRLGGGTFGSGIEISYQKALSEKNRIEFDLGANNNDLWNAFGLAVVYHWHWNIVDGLNWYAGPGGSVSMFSNKLSNSSFVNLGVGGQIGLEYDFQEFDVPLLVSLDTRPMFGLTGDSSYRGFGWGVALAVRYLF